MITSTSRDDLRSLVSLGITGSLHGMIHTLSLFLSPLNAEIARYFGLETISTVTAFKSSYLLVYAASNLLFGALTNRIPARQVLSLGMIMNAAVIMLFRFVPPTGVPLMFLLWILAAVGGGVYHPVANAFITRLYPRRKGWALGVTGMGAGIGYAFGPLLTGFLSGVLGLAWQDISLVFGGIGLLCGAAAFILIREPPPARAAARPAALRPADDSPERVGGLFGLPSALWVFLLFAVAIAGTRDFAMWTILDISDFYLKTAFPGGASTAWFLFVMYLPGVFTQPMAGSLSDKLGRKRLATAAFLLYGLAISSLAFFPGNLLFIPYMLMGASSSATIPVMEALVADFTTARTRGIIFGVFVTAIMGAGALGPLLSGLYLDALGRTLGAFRSWMLISGGLVVAAGIGMTASGALIRRLGLKAEKEHAA